MSLEGIVRKLFVLIPVFIFLFCQIASAGFFDPNPQANFKEADYLLSVNRSLAADKLINDVIVFCSKKDDEPCLAQAYYNFGKILMSNGAKIDKWYKIMSYVEQDITSDNIHQKAMEYFEKALALAKKHELNDVTSGIYIKMGILQSLYFKPKATACKYFDQSLLYHNIYVKNHPNANITLQKGFNSFDEYIAEGKKEIGCSI